MWNVLNQKKILFQIFPIFIFWVIVIFSHFCSKNCQFSMNFHDNSKNSDRKIDFLFDSAHCASIFHENGIQNEKGRGVCISLLGTGPNIIQYFWFSRKTQISCHGWCTFITTPYGLAHQSRKFYGIKMNLTPSLRSLVMKTRNLSQRRWRIVATKVNVFAGENLLASMVLTVEVKNLSQN